MSLDFGHLHCHTEHSTLDGLASISGLVDEVARLGQPGVAITDHGSLAGVYRFVNACLKRGVKPVVGVEAYMAPESRHVHAPVLWGCGGENDVSAKGKYTHMTLYARDAVGLRSLFKLHSEAWATPYAGKARLDLELLAEHSEGLVATTGCPSSHVQTRLRLGQYQAAVEHAEALQAILGRDSVYCEVMRHGLRVEEAAFDSLLRLGRELDMPLLATNDLHYVDKADSFAHNVMLTGGTGRHFMDPKAFKFDGREYYVKSSEEMTTLFADIPQAVTNTVGLIESAGDYNLTGQVGQFMPTVPDAEDELRRQVMHWVADKPAEYRKRVEFELSVILPKNYAGYFLVNAEMVGWAKDQGIRVGPGRGSGAGSLVAYALGITTIDPMRYGLMFERFLNPERDSPPDFDIDFCEVRRHEVVDWAVDRFGQDHVCQIGTTGTLKPKAAIELAGKGLNVALADVVKLKQAWPAAQAGKEQDMSCIDDPNHRAYDAASEVRALIESDYELAEVVNIARTFENNASRPGTHAAGILISPVPVTDHVPLRRTKTGGWATEWDYPECESLGFIKFDLLGLSTLACIDMAVENIRQHSPDVELDLEGYDDPSVFEFVGTGLTDGVFQLESSGMQDLCRMIRPTSMHDLSAIIALYRPGPMGVGAHVGYADRKNGRAEVALHYGSANDAMSDVLGETFGYFVYQEQIMAASRVLCGFSLAEADLLRRAVGKKKDEDMAKLHPEFVSRGVAEGFAREDVEAVWRDILPAVDYSFAKGHSMAYAAITYQMAYLRTHYPAEFYAAALRTAKDSDKVSQLMESALAAGMTVTPPCVRYGQVDTSGQDGTVRLGMADIKGCGRAVGERIVQARQGLANVTFSSLMAAYGPAGIPLKELDGLADVGAFRALADEPTSAAVHAWAKSKDRTKWQAEWKRTLATGDWLLRHEPKPTNPPELTLPTAEPATGFEVAARECDRLGVVLSNQRIKNLPDGRYVILSLDIKTSKRGRQYAQLTLCGNAGTVHVKAWANHVPALTNLTSGDVIQASLDQTGDMHTLKRFTPIEPR